MSDTIGELIFPSDSKRRDQRQVLKVKLFMAATWNSSLPNRRLSPPLTQLHSSD